MDGFQYGHNNYQSITTRFSEDANRHYTYSSADELVDEPTVLNQMIEHHMNRQRPRLETLQGYYKGNNTGILRSARRIEDHLADNRASHGFAEYVSGFIQGYLVGIPIKTGYPDENTEEQIREINRDNDADEHNSELVLDQSIYGRAYELLYRSQDDKTKFTTSDVLQTFVIYNDTVERVPIAAIRYMTNVINDETTVYLYTENEVHTYSKEEDELSKQDEQSHAFGGVQIIEYENNKFRIGDFERVLSLIDLYDEAQSDTANYMTDLNDAMLKITGNLDLDVDEAKEMKEANLLFLQTEQNSEGKSGQADADYIYKKYDVQGTEKYKDRVANDIHMFTSTPNMNDENFSGVQSGEAAKYKLFALEQKRATKERLFKKSLRDRYRLIDNLLTIASEGGFDVNDIDITFTPNLPISLTNEIEAFAKLGGDLSDETKLSILSIVDNPTEELERINKENPQMNRNEDMFDFPDDDAE